MFEMNIEGRDTRGRKLANMQAIEKTNKPLLKNKNLAQDILYSMQLIRGFEEKAVNLVMQGEIQGAVHPSIGQEAVAVGACKALNKDDYILSTHRGHNHCICTFSL